MIWQGWGWNSGHCAPKASTEPVSYAPSTYRFDADPYVEVEVFFFTFLLHRLVQFISPI